MAFCCDKISPQNRSSILTDLQLTAPSAQNKRDAVPSKNVLQFKKIEINDS